MRQTSNTFRLATVSDEGLHWTLRRNCAVSPAQMAAVLTALGCLSLAVALFFWFQGAVLVLPFAVLELAALLVAFVVHARHAADREHVSLQGDYLIVEHEIAGRVQRSEFPTAWVRVVHSVRGGLVEVRSGAHTVQVGRYLRPDLRHVLVHELRYALHAV
ncbi:MAG: hypothetical protein RLZZ352_2162 [Pseudomonadota bacterium]